MTAATRTTIKSYFQTGDKPTQSQFSDFIDSCAFLAEVSAQVFAGSIATPLVSATKGEFTTVSAGTGIFASVSAGTMNFNTVAKNTNTNAGATAAFVINQAASAATMEAAASLTEFVPPGLQQRHPSAAKFWAKLNGATGAILASYNVTSATRVSTGNYIVSYVTNFSSVNYGGNVTPLDSGTPLIGQWLSQAAGNCQIQVLNLSGLVTDPTAVTVTGFGDQ